MDDFELSDLYTDYLITAFGQITSTGLLLGLSTGKSLLLSERGSSILKQLFEYNL